MNVITKQDTIKRAIRSFRKQWGDGTYTSDRRGRMVGAELAALDPETATADDVDEIIGNDSWTKLACDECGRQDVNNVVQVGQPPDYESATANLCFACIERAARLVQNGRPGERPDCSTRCVLRRGATETHTHPGGHSPGANATGERQG